MAFTAMLSQQMPYAPATEKLHLQAMVVSRWTRRTRAWLLRLNPSGGPLFQYIDNLSDPAEAQSEYAIDPLCRR
jgi:hypothetical protein